MDKILEFLKNYGINALDEYKRWLRKIRIGLVVNPIAGMGGRVGLKGTDNKYELALKLGAKPVAPKRAVDFLKHLIKDIELYTYPKDMGENEAREVGFNPIVVGEIGDRTSSEDTKRAVKELLSMVELIVFVGGDGTARDICEVIGDKIPVIGVPAGVKMYSAVFALNPKACARVVNEFVRGNVSFELREVMDVENTTSPKLFGYMKVPIISDLVQNVKVPDRGNKDGVLSNFLRIFDKNTVYIFGPGGTTYHLAKSLGFDKTLLGVDIYLNGKVLVRDANEKDIINILDKYNNVKLVVTPIGGQGFLFGRGNLQISPIVLRRIGKENIIIVSTADKLKSFDSLKVDTGDEELDKELEGEMNVLTDIGFIRVKIKC